MQLGVLKLFAAWLRIEFGFEVCHELGMQVCHLAVHLLVVFGSVIQNLILHHAIGISDYKTNHTFPGKQIRLGVNYGAHTRFVVIDTHAVITSKG